MLQSSNPTAQQSQRWIIEALLELMKIAEYDKISVSEICRKADIDRRTFYRNFSSKKDVLEEYINLLGNEYIHTFTMLEKPDSYTASKFFFEFWDRHLSFINNIKKCGLSDFVFLQFQKFAKEHRELLIGDDIQKLPAEYVFTYRIGGFWNIMMTWAEDNPRLSPDEIALIILQI